MVLSCLDHKVSVLVFVSSGERCRWPVSPPPAGLWHRGSQDFVFRLCRLYQVRTSFLIQGLRRKGSLLLFYITFLPLFPLLQGVWVNWWCGCWPKHKCQLFECKLNLRYAHFKCNILDVCCCGILVCLITLFGVHRRKWPRPGGWIHRSPLLSVCTSLCLSIWTDLVSIGTAAANQMHDKLRLTISHCDTWLDDVSHHSTFSWSLSTIQHW